MKSFHQIISVIALLLISTVAGAVINPAEYTKGATEELTAEFAGVSVEDEKKSLTRVCLIAKVLKVVKSETGLKPGDVIMIKYSRDRAREAKERRAMKERTKTGWVGPQILHAPDVPKVGDKRVLFLKKCKKSEGLVYLPAAHQYSFSIRGPV